MQLIGFIATGMIVLAYLPQLIHMFRAKCTAGISISAYLLWALASGALLWYAIQIDDLVFISLYGYQLIATTIIFLLAWKNGDCKCEQHGGH